MATGGSKGVTEEHVLEVFQEKGRGASLSEDCGGCGGGCRTNCCGGAGGASASPSARSEERGSEEGDNDEEARGQNSGAGSSLAVGAREDEAEHTSDFQALLDYLVLEDNKDGHQKGRLGNLCKGLQELTRRVIDRKEQCKIKLELLQRELNQKQRGTLCIFYLEHIRQQKGRRRQLRKEQQEHTRRVIERKERDQRTLELIQRELNQERDEKETEEKSRQAALEDSRHQIARLQARLRESACKEQQLQSKIKNQMESLDRNTRDLTLLRELVSQQREDMECSVCLGPFAEPVTLSCSHTFCAACIEGARRTAEACPLCRRPIITHTRCLVLDKLAAGFLVLDELSPSQT